MSYTKITNFAIKDSTNDIIKGTEFDDEFNSIEASFTAQPSATQTLTNKTIALGSNTVSGTFAQFNTAVTDADLARTDAANTFTGVQTLSSQPILSALTASSAVATDASKGLVSVTNTGSGNNVLATTPSFVSTLGVGAATPSASGAGITFPATQSASTDANTLDDYEEGTWTPNQGSGLTVVGAFSSSGSYTKVGRLVTVDVRLVGATSIAIAANSIALTNLPFTAGAAYGFGNGTNAAFTANAGFGVNTSSTVIYATTTIAATTSIFFTLTYQVA